MDTKKSLLDSPFRISLAYREQTGSLIEMLDRLKSEEAYNRERIFKTFWPHIEQIVPDLAGGAIFGLMDDKVKCHIEETKITSSMEKWDDLDSQSKKITISAMKNDEAKEVVFWNYEEDAPLFVTNSRKNQAVALSWLCEHPDGENLFLLLVRNIEKRPFLSHEIQAIKITSRIVGGFANYAFTYQLLKYGISETFKKTMKTSP